MQTNLDGIFKGFVYDYGSIYYVVLQQCKLTSLETRRVRCDQILYVFKIAHGIGFDSGMLKKNIGQTTEHEDIVGLWLKNGVN